MKECKVLMCVGIFSLMTFSILDENENRFWHSIEQKGEDAATTSASASALFVWFLLLLVKACVVCVVSGGGFG